MRRKIIISLLTAVFLAALLCLSVSANVTGGKLGTDGLTWKYDSETCELTINGSGQMPSVDYTALPWAGFRGEIKTITISENVTYIHDSAFRGCDALEKITLPYTMGSDIVGYGTVFGIIFGWTTYVSSSSEPAAVKEGKTYQGYRYYSDYSYYNYYYYIPATLNEVIINNGNSIPKNAFYNCKTISKISLPAGIETIGSFAFRNCSALVDFSIPKSVTSIGNYAFYDCSSLTTVNCEATFDEWLEVSMGEGNGPLFAATFNYGVVMHEHNYIPEVTKEATCAEAGEKTLTCSVCGDSYTEVIPKAAHTTTTVSGKAATCTMTGLTDGIKCSKCGEILTAQTVIPALGHRWDSGKITKQPTETENGIRTFTCTRTGCGETKTETIPKTGNQISVSVTHTGTCEHIGDTVSFDVSLTGKLSAFAIVPTFDGKLFKVVSGKITARDTAMKSFGLADAKGNPANGVAAWDCVEEYPGGYEAEGSACTFVLELIGELTEETTVGIDIVWDDADTFAHHNLSEKAAVLSPHTHTPVTVPGTPATCTETGLTDGVKCSECGEILTAQTVIPALGHLFGDSYCVTKLPTAEEEGVRSCKCLREGCTETVDEAIPKTRFVSDQVTFSLEHTGTISKAGDSATVTLKAAGSIISFSLIPQYDKTMLTLTEGKITVEDADIKSFSKTDGNGVCSYYEFTEVDGEVAYFTLEALKDNTEDTVVICRVNYEDENGDVQTAYVSTVIPSVLRGDFNGDEKVSSVDAVYLLRNILVGAENYPLNQNGDVNGDGKTTSTDAVYLLRHVLVGAEAYPLS